MEALEQEYLEKQGVVTSGLAKAGDLPPDMLTGYLQVQIDSVVSIRSSDAKGLYLLTAEDLHTCKDIRDAPICNRNAKWRQGSSKKRKDSVPDQRACYKQVQ